MNAVMKYGAAALVALLQSGVLGYMVESRAQVLRNGQEIVLRTKPVDPNDILRGDYVILGYDISSIDPKLIAGTAPDKSGIASVFVALKKQGEVWTLSRANWQPFSDKTADEVVIKGQTGQYFYLDAEQPVPLNYGIEAFYVPQGAGKVIEDGQRAEAVDAVVAVNDSGTAQLKSLRLNGKTLYDEPLY